VINVPECVFEEEILAAALQSRWPDRIPAELRQHAAACSLCRDLAEAASAISELRESEVSVPDAGRIWWMAQMRARRDAIKTAGRPITAIQVAALGCAAGLAGACFGATSEWFQAMLRWGTPSLWATIAEHAALALAVLGILIVLPAVLYFVLERD
jgi:predicted anti-sigma-YlaC factor YlaD